jgi:AcrR family transcriptional regulator
LVNEVAQAATAQLTALRRGTAGSPEVASGPRRRGRPTVQDPIIEHTLLDSALELIEKDGRALSARAVAARAGCDPALITYYFGGRNGLYQRVAEQLVAELTAEYHDGVRSGGTTLTRLHAGLTNIVATVARRPQLATFLIDQCLVHGTSASDDALAAIVGPYLSSVAELADQLSAEGTFRTLEDNVARYSLAILPTFIAALAPVIHRALRGPIVPLAPDELAEEILRLVLYGALPEEPLGDGV